MALPPRKKSYNFTPTKVTKQTSLQILQQMGFSKNRAEKALAATGNVDVQLAVDWILSHVNDNCLDECVPREYSLYAVPTGEFLEQLEEFWIKSRELCGFNGAHNYLPHITLVSFFKAQDEYSNELSNVLQDIMDNVGHHLNRALTLELYSSSNFMGFFVAEDDANFLKRLALEYVKEVSNLIINDSYNEQSLDALKTCFPWCGSIGITQSTRCIPKASRSISLEPHSNGLHLTLAYQFLPSKYNELNALVKTLNPKCSTNWELRLYSRDNRLGTKQVHRVLFPHAAREPDELELRIGDFIYIDGEHLQNSTDGWVDGVSWLTGCNGYLPENYTERTAESDAWTLHQTITLNSPNNNNYRTLDVVDCAQQFTPNTNDNFSKESVLSSEIKEMTAKKPQTIITMRHGERVDFNFGSQWHTQSFNDADEYTQTDINMPATLPKRAEGPVAWVKDSPLTTLGLEQAKLTGLSLKANGVHFDRVYCSPSFRCLQTCSEVLKAMGSEAKICIEPGLFEWLAWYIELPFWISNEELIAHGFNIDTSYKPITTREDLKSQFLEQLEEFYDRNAAVVQNVLQKDNFDGNILLVAHAITLDTCTRKTVGSPPRTLVEISSFLKKIPYCSLCAIEKCPVTDKFKFVEPPCLPLTLTNLKFDWKFLNN